MHNLDWLFLSQPLLGRRTGEQELQSHLEQTFSNYDMVISRPNTNSKEKPHELPLLYCGRQATLDHIRFALTLLSRVDCAGQEYVFKILL